MTTVNDVATITIEVPGTQGPAGPAAPLNAWATASRPAATSVAAGTPGFDLTLGKPIWSDGTHWVDATGTVV